MYTITGVDAVETALDAMLARVQVATPIACHDAAETTARRAVALLTAKEHPRGTPTPSAPGEPPAKISGRLSESLRITPPHPEGTGWAVELGPTAPYARVQELGGDTGRGHRTHLPARPYLQPAVEDTRAEVWAVFRAAWEAALRA